MSAKWTERNKSQSPALAFSAPRPFLPPSHYAAAGGFPYPKAREPLNNWNGPREDPSTSNSSYQDPRSRIQPLNEPAASGSESSFEFRSKDTKLKLTGEIKSVLSTRPSPRTRQGLPHAEADLLPSLQTTIHRMTRPPSKVATGLPPKSAHSDVKKEQPNAKSNSIHKPSQNPNDVLSPSNLWQGQHSTTSRRDTLTPNPVITDAPSTSKIPQKSALKSALRTPTQKQTPASVDSPKTWSPGRTSLRSVKSLLSRRLANVSTPQIPSQPAVSLVPTPAMPKNESNNNASRTETKTPSLCNLPCPRTKSDHLKTPVPSVASQHPRADESDLENKFQRQWMDKRRLTVANAEVVPSGSSSESDVDSSSLSHINHSNNDAWTPSSMIQALSTPKPAWKGPSRKYASVGLGLDMPAHAQASHSPLLPDFNANTDRDRTKILRFSLPPSDSGASLYSNSRHLSYPGSWDGTDYSSEQDDNNGTSTPGPRQQTDARQLPAEFNNGGNMAAEGRLADESDADSDYWGEEGSAISGSEEFADNSRSADESISEDETFEAPSSDSGPSKARASLSGWGQGLHPGMDFRDSISEVPQPTRPASITQLLAQRQHPTQYSQPSSPYTPKHNQSQIHSAPAQTNVTNQWFNESSQEDDLDFGRSPPSPAGKRKSSNSRVASYDARAVAGLSQQAKYHPQQEHRASTIYDVGLEAASLSQQSKYHAFQERQAFGIPPSDSDEVYRNHPSQRWSQSDSYRSSTGSNQWQWEDTTLQQQGNDDSLSTGAESMIKSIHSESTPQETGRPQKPVATPTPSHLRVISISSSASSLYEDPEAQSDAPDDEDTPQQFLPPEQARGVHAAEAPVMEATHAYDSHLAPPKMLKSREEAIMEFIRTEETFLCNVQTCVDCFILPIRAQKSRSWIGGVPPNVSRLLDWYEDIVNLHIRIFQSLESSTSSQEQEGRSIVSGLAAYLIDFVPKLHIYQPYLINLTDVLEEIVERLSDPNSDFGEFVRMQEYTLRSAGWTFEGLLMEPVHRLAAYQNLFTHLLDLTPPSHPEFLATFSLARSTDMVMKAMMEVKLRENEYKLIRSVASDISDPVVADMLTTRERRLLHSGTLRLISPALAEAKPPIVDSPSNASRNPKAKKRASRLAEAITAWDRKPERSNSVKSVSSSITVSVKSSNTASTGDPKQLLNASSSRLPKFKRLFKGKSAPAPVPPPSPFVASDDVVTIPSDYIQAFVFSDLLLLVTPRVPGSSKSELVRSIGLSRVFSVSRDEAVSNGFTIQTIAVHPKSINQDSIPALASLTSATLQLRVHQDYPARDSLAQEQTTDLELGLWISSLQQCSENTLQMLSFPSARDFCAQSEQSKDTWLVVSSLVSSGLPMPKSPSGQLPDLQYCQKGEEARTMEREERGWWTVRYQQVLGDLRRQNVPVNF